MLEENAFHVCVRLFYIMWAQQQKAAKLTFRLIANDDDNEQVLRQQTTAHQVTYGGGVLPPLLDDQRVCINM